MEDGDICRRFELAGLGTFKLFRLGLAWHLWHKEADTTHYEQSRRHYARVEAERRPDCADGLAQSRQRMLADGTVVRR